MDFCYVKVTGGPVLEKIEEILERRNAEAKKVREFVNFHKARAVVSFAGALHDTTFRGLVFPNKESIPTGWKRDVALSPSDKQEVWCMPDRKTKEGKEANKLLNKLEISGFEDVLGELIAPKKVVDDNNKKAYYTSIASASKCWLVRIPTCIENMYRVPKKEGLEEITTTQMLDLILKQEQEKKHATA